VRSTVDQNGNVDGYDDYYPFGLQMPGRSSNSANPNDQYKFTGHEDDDEAGLDIYHANARGYDPVLGRFMQMDPLLEFASPYVYVGNNPLSFTDPTGLYSVGRGGSNEFGVLNGGGVVGTPEEDQFGEFFDYERFEQQQKQEEAAQGNDCPPCGEGEANSTRIGLTASSLGALGMASTKLELELSTELYGRGFRLGIAGNYQLRGRNLNLFKDAPMTDATRPLTKITGLGRTVSGLGRATAGVGLVYDTNLLFRGRISYGRWGYRTGVTGGSFLAGSSFGGPAGLTVGLIGTTAEVGYDLFRYLRKELSIKIGATEAAMRRGWIPRFPQ